MSCRTGNSFTACKQPSKYVRKPPAKFNTMLTQLLSTHLSLSLSLCFFQCVFYLIGRFTTISLDSAKGTSNSAAKRGQAINHTYDTILMYVFLPAHCKRVQNNCQIEDETKKNSCKLIYSQ